MKLGDGEKLILVMLCDIYEKTGIKGEIDPAFVRELICSGHTWGLRWKYPGVFSSAYENNPEDVTEVVEVLDMWELIESVFGALPAGEQERVKTACARSVMFQGYDGNDETGHMSIAKYLVDDLGRFSSFKGRDFNSHRQVRGEYARMLKVFKPTRAMLDGVKLTADQLIQILKAR